MRDFMDALISVPTMLEVVRERGAEICAAYGAIVRSDSRVGGMRQLTAATQSLTMPGDPCGLACPLGSTFGPPTADPQSAHDQQGHALQAEHVVHYSMGLRGTEMLRGDGQNHQASMRNVLLVSMLEPLEQIGDLTRESSSLMHEGLDRSGMSDQPGHEELQDAPADDPIGYGTAMLVVALSVYARQHCHALRAVQLDGSTRVGAMVDDAMRLYSQQCRACAGEGERLEIHKVVAAVLDEVLRMHSQQGNAGQGAQVDYSAGIAALMRTAQQVYRPLQHAWETNQRHEVRVMQGVLSGQRSLHIPLPSPYGWQHDYTRHDYTRHLSGLMEQCLHAAPNRRTVTYLHELDQLMTVLGEFVRQILQNVSHPGALTEREGAGGRSNTR
jgi:hypothetical protein